MNADNNDDLETVSISYTVTTDKPSVLDSDYPSRTFTITDEQTNEILDMLKMSLHKDELYLKQNNADDEMQTINIETLLNAKEESGDEDDVDLEEKRDEIRLARLEETRPKWLTLSLKICFHFMVFANFFSSWFDSSRLLMEDAKMNMWLLLDDYNCLGIVTSVDYVDHTMNILHALLSCSVLYVHKRNSATLCLAWIFSQAIHTSFKTFQHFYNLKFEKESFADFAKINVLASVVMFDVVGTLLLLHKYYDLTDCFKARAKYYGTTDTTERTLNDKIIFKNESSYIQRKSILREATTAQTYAIIKKIGKHGKRGFKVDPVSLDREIKAAKLALDDSSNANNHNMMYMLKKAYARRLKELEDIALSEMQEKGIARKYDSSERHPPIIHSEVY